MALCPAMVFTTLAAENDDFRATCLAHDRCADGGAINFWRANRHLVAIGQHNNVIQNDLGAFFCGNTLNKDGVILCDAILLATCFHQSIHGDLPYHNSLTPAHPSHWLLFRCRCRQCNSSFATIANHAVRYILFMTIYAWQLINAR